MNDEETSEWNWSVEVAALQQEIADLDAHIAVLRVDLLEARLMMQLESESRS